MGDNLSRQNQHEKAEKHYKSALEARELLHEIINNAKSLKSLVFMYNRMGGCLAAQGRKEEADAYYENASKII
jgi:tetratricopeptide (TPR) repeat protein